MSEGQGSDRAFIERSLRVGITASVVLATALLLLYLLKGALTPLVVAWLIAYLFDPLIDRFEAWGVGRSPAILLLLLLIGAAGAGVALFGIPALQGELRALSAGLPQYAEAVFGRLVPFLEGELGLALPHSVEEAIASIRGGEIPIPLDAARSLLERALTTLTGTVGTLVSLLIIPVLAYYLLVEFDRIRFAVVDLVPPAYQETLRREATRVDSLISGFIRGQLTVCFILGGLYAFGFAVIGIDLAFVIGMMAGIAALVPYVGGAIAILSAGGLCLVQFGVDFHLALVIGWYAICQGLEGLVLTPRILGDRLGMHPVVVIVALMIGGDLLGFLGLMIAVPAAALVQVFVQDAVAWYRESPLYRSGAET